MAAKRTTLSVLAPFTGAGNSIDVDIQTGTMMHVEVDITAGSGTPTFSLWMEGSVDGSATWFRLVADLLNTDINGTIADVATPRSNIVNASTATTVDRYSAVYKHLPCDKVRARWTMTGGTPSRTFAVYIGVK